MYTSVVESMVKSEGCHLDIRTKMAIEGAQAVGDAGASSY